MAEACYLICRFTLLRKLKTPDFHLYFRFEVSPELGSYRHFRKRASKENKYSLVALRNGPLRREPAREPVDDAPGRMASVTGSRRPQKLVGLAPATRQFRRHRGSANLPTCACRFDSLLPYSWDKKTKIAFKLQVFTCFCHASLTSCIA